MRNGDRPNVKYFMYRNHYGRDPASRYWILGPYLERKYGVFGITDRLKAKYHYFYYMSPTRPHTPAADIRSRQLGALESVIFQPVMPASVATPLVRPLYMKVSSWVSNQLIPG